MPERSTNREPLLSREGAPHQDAGSLQSERFHDLAGNGRPSFLLTGMFPICFASFAVFVYSTGLPAPHPPQKRSSITLSLRHSPEASPSEPPTSRQRVHGMNACGRQPGRATVHNSCGADSLESMDRQPVGTLPRSASWPGPPSLRPCNKCPAPDALASRARLPSSWHIDSPCNQVGDDWPDSRATHAVGPVLGWGTKLSSMRQSQQQRQSLWYKGKPSNDPSARIAFELAYFIRNCRSKYSSIAD